MLSHFWGFVKPPEAKRGIYALLACFYVVISTIYLLFIVFYLFLDK